MSEHTQHSRMSEDNTESDAVVELSPPSTDQMDADPPQQDLVHRFVEDAEQRHRSGEPYSDPNIVVPQLFVGSLASANPAGSGTHNSTFATVSVDSFLNGRIITITVGNARTWSVHEALLSAKSPFFRRLLNQDEAGRKMKEIDFSEIEPKLFSMFLQWMYGTTFGPSTGPRIFRYPIPDGEEYTVSDYIRLYILGHKFEIAGMKNAAIDAVYGYFADQEHEVRAPDVYDVQLVFDNTPEGSPMRRLLTAHLLFYLFNKHRHDIGQLPAQWEEVMTHDPVVTFAMMKMLSEWGWGIGTNVPPMKIKQRQSFHDPIVVDDDDEEGVKNEPVE